MALSALERDRRYRHKYPEKRRENAKRYAEKYPERRRESARRYAQRNPEKIRDKRRRGECIRNGYLPPPLERDCPPRPEDGRCELCKQIVAKFHLDHDHVTGKFRGWLCCKCNLELGIIEKIGLEAICEYLTRGA